MSTLLKKHRLVKLRSCKDTKKFGIAADNLNELLIKGCKLLQLPLNGCHVCLYEDGTEVTEKYFSTLQNNVELVLLSEDETWGGFACDIGRLLDTDRHADQLVKAAKGLLSADLSPKQRKLLGDLLTNLDESSEKETREEDEAWFQGLQSRFKTKSAYMKYNCENRIRGYMKELESCAKNIKKDKLRAEFNKTVESLMDKLKSARYNGCYFDRTETEARRLCTKQGWFTCQGPFDQITCQSLHSINPYGNWESRVVFSTWNLDHSIEKKRAVIPALLEALQNRNSTDINLNYFYSLLFTRENLKLVHITCHKKETHDLQCDQRKIYKLTNQKRKGKR